MARPQKAPQKFVSWNVNGLNTPEKRYIALRVLYRLRAGVCFIQETHFRKDAIPRLQNRRYPQMYHSCSPESKSKWVSILIGQKNVWADTESRILFVKGTIWYTALYVSIGICAELGTGAIYRGRSWKATSICRRYVNLRGDWNVTLDPLLDSTSNAPPPVLLSFRSDL